jgi:hypothetical protein
VVVGQIILPYSGNSWTKTSVGWPFGQIELVGDGVRFSARWLKRFFRPITLHRDEVTSVRQEERPLFRWLGRGFEFRTIRPEVDGITFWAYGSKAKALEQLVNEFLAAQSTAREA